MKMVKNIIKASLGATVLAFSIGSAVAAEPVEKMSIMPQNVQPMPAAELDSVRGMWAEKMPNSRSQSQVDALNLPSHLGACPPGFDNL
jgi:hypothetical protein